MTGSAAAGPVVAAPPPTAVEIDDPRLVAMLEAGEPDIGTVWELCMMFEFDRDATVRDIAAWIGPPQGVRVLDCACGSGFPALGLVARGYDVTCTDGSSLMLEHFARNAGLEGVDVRAQRLSWDELPGRYPGRFDVVLNRGCGNYRYAGVWDHGGLADRGAMAEAIGHWVACLRPGGRLYVDIPPDPGPDVAPTTTTRHPTLLVGGHVVDLVERIAVDRATGIRTWNTWLTVDGRAYEFERRAFHVVADELVAVLADCGLVDVHQVDVPGEFYDVYCGVRPAGPTSPTHPRTA
jgi:SAM-dependent methyltransferase